MSKKNKKKNENAVEIPPEEKIDASAIPSADEIAEETSEAVETVETAEAVEVSENPEADEETVEEGVGEISEEAVQKKEKAPKKKSRAGKMIGRIALIILAAVVGVAVLVVGGLNLLKFALYGEYYSMSENLCKNPGLSDGFVCQGIAADEQSGTVFVSGYMTDGSASRIYITNEENDSYYITLQKDREAFDGHVGGVAVAKNMLYIADGGRVYTVGLNAVLETARGGALDIGNGVKVNNEASFICSDGEYIYVGEFHNGGAYNIVGHENETPEGTHYAICTKYDARDLVNPVKVYSIRNEVQGICFTPDGKVILSTSYGLNDSHYYVYNEASAIDSGKTLDGAPLYYLNFAIEEVKGPAMAEGLAWYKGKVITLTESASNKYIFGKFFFADNIVSLDFSEGN